MAASKPDCVEAISKVAILYIQVGEHELALDYLMEWLRLQPDNPNLKHLVRMAVTHQFRRQIQTAEARIAADPQDVQAYLWMARNLAMIDENGAALGILTEGIIENPAASSLWLMIGALEVKANRENEALAAYREAIQLDGENGLARNNLAYLLVKADDRSLHNPPLAMAHAMEAVRLEPNNTSFLDTLAEVYFKLGHAGQAVALMQRAIELNPADPFYKEQLMRFRRAVKTF